MQGMRVATGSLGYDGDQGETGKPGEGTTVIVGPPRIRHRRTEVNQRAQPKIPRIFSVAPDLPAPWRALALLFLASCSTLPTIVPDREPPSGPPVQLEGASGPLSAAKSKAVLDGLEKKSKDTDIFDRHLALEEAIVGSPLTTGNQVLLLQDGPATYQAMFAAILGARDNINMETYILEDDEIGQRFAQALIDKQQQGVQVNLIRDSAGTFGTPAAFFEQDGRQRHQRARVQPDQSR